MNLNDTRDRIRWTPFAVLVGLALILLILDSTGNLDRTFDFLHDPMAAVLSWTAARTDVLADALAGPRDLQAAHQEIGQLKARIEELERQNEELREVQGEYQLLLDLFNRARETPQYRRITASVIGRDTSPYFRSIIIDKGVDHGIYVGMPVEAARGLVGLVYRTTANSSQVLLVTDNISSIPARLGDSRAIGIVSGGGLGGVMTMDWISLESQIRPGEVVITSGLGGMFPPDLIIGRAVEVERREAKLFQRAIVHPAVNFESLEIVFVITDFRPIDTSIFDRPPGR